MTLRLRPEARWVESGSGAYVVSNAGAVHLPGASVCRWLERLAPHLDGRRDLDELAAGLPPERASALRRVVMSLVQTGVVVEEQAPAPEAYGEAAMLHELTGVALRTPRVAVLGQGTLRADLRTALAAAGVEETAGDSHPAPPAGVLALACADGRPGVQVLLGGQEAWFGRDLRPALRRVGPPDSGPPPSAGVRSVLAAQVTRHLLRCLVAAGDDRVHVVRLPQLGATTHVVTPHPADTVADPRPVAERVAALAAAEPVDPEVFSRAAVHLCDEKFGVCGAIDEGDVPQVPLKVATASVADPHARLDTRPRVVGAGDDVATARHRTALRALARYAALAHDPQPGQRVDGVRLDGRGTGGLSADRAFPAAEAPGLAAAYDWAGAVTAGLLGCAAALLFSHPGPHAELAVGLDPVGEHYRAQAGALREPITCRDVTAWLGIPAVACVRAGRTVAAACGLSLADAARSALEQALLARQLGTPALPGLPARNCRPPASPELTVPDLVAALGRLGHVPLVVPLDRDPAVTAVLPFLVHVVLDAD